MDDLSSAILEHAASMRREADRAEAIARARVERMQRAVDSDPLDWPSDTWIMDARHASFLRGQAFSLRAHAAAIEGLAMGGESYLDLVERAHTAESMQRSKKQ